MDLEAASRVPLTGSSSSNRKRRPLSSSAVEAALPESDFAMSTSVMTVAIVVPMVVLGVAVVLLFRPFLRSWARTLKTRVVSASFELALCSPFLATCVFKASKSEPRCLTAWVKGTWLALVHGGWILAALLPLAWFVRLPERWRPLCLYAPLLVYYFPTTTTTTETTTQTTQTQTLAAAQLPQKATTTGVACPPSKTTANPSGGPCPCPPSKTKTTTTTTTLPENQGGPPGQDSGAAGAPGGVRWSWRRLLRDARTAFEVALFFGPQMAAVSSLTKFFGLRFHSPLVRVVDARLAVGSAPVVPGDVALLATKFRVGSVLEVRPPWSKAFSLPGKAYEFPELDGDAAGVEYLGLEARDSLTMDDVRAAAAFLKRRVDAEPHKRVFVCCSDGQRFAPSLVAAYLVFTQHCDLDQAASALDRRLPNRPSLSILANPTLRFFADKLRADRDLDDGWALIDRTDVCEIGGAAGV